MWGITMMKKLSIIAVVLLFALATQVFALDVSTDDVTFGTARDPVTMSNPEAYRSRDRVIIEDSNDVFTITNNQSESVEIQNISFSASGYNMNFTNEANNSLITSSFTLGVNESIDIKVTSIIPHGLDAIATGDNNRIESIVESQNVGNINIAIANQSNINIPVKMFVRPVIDIRDIEILVDGESFFPGDNDLREIRPGSIISVCVDVENLYDWDDKNSDLRTTIEFKSDSSGLRFDSRSIVEDLIPGDLIEQICSDIDTDDRRLNLPESSDIEVVLSGRDQFNALHQITYSFNIRVRTPQWDAGLLSPRINPSSVCPGDVFTASFGVENTGSRDQSHIQTETTLTHFNFERIEGPFKLDGVDSRGNTDSRDFSYSVNVPTTAAPGSYPVVFEVFYQDRAGSGNRDSEVETVTLTVRDCTTPTQNETPPVVVDPDPEPTTPAEGQVVATARPRTNDALLVTGLVVLALLLIAVLVALILVLRR